MAPKKTKKNGLSGWLVKNIQNVFVILYAPVLALLFVCLFDWLIQFALFNFNRVNWLYCCLVHVRARACRIQRRIWTKACSQQSATGRKNWAPWNDRPSSHARRSSSFTADSNRSDTHLHLGHVTLALLAFHSIRLRYITRVLYSIPRLG